MRVLAIGDPYMPVTCFAEALASLGEAVTVTQMQIDRIDSEPPRTESEHRLREYAGDPAEVARAAAGHDVLVVHGAPVSAEALGAPGLRLVCCARGGPVNVDVAAATEHGIPVANTPGKNAEAVADLTIAFALMLIRGVPRANRYLADRGTFSESVFDGREFFGREAPGTVLGLVGLGHVGRNVATRALALGFDVIAHDPVPPAIVPRDVRLVSLDRLIADADIVSVHARATPANRHMFSAPVFAQMKAGACFINTARESLVDEDALSEAVRSGALAGAALDVMERPAGGARHPLLDLPQVFITPHIGGATQETLDRGARQATAAVAAILAGQCPDAVVNPEVFDRVPLTERGGAA
ncbi:MAG: NAD(P)-dependent oxidoreductase [Streptosporangiaceae bacterium]